MDENLENQTEFNETGEPTSTTPKAMSRDDKISAIHSSLVQLEQEEDDAETERRVADSILRAKERKEHPERFVQPKTKKRKTTRRSFGQVFLDQFPQKGDGAGEVVRKLVFLLSTTVFLVCLALIGMYLLDLYQAKQVYEDIGTEYHARVPEKIEEETTETAHDDVKHYSLLPGVDELLSVNDEIVGWITIPDTNVDYPLLQHKDDSSDEQYYLYRNVLREDSKPGSIFLDFRCDFDNVGEDMTLSTPNSDNLIIYGHNMRDLSMFGTLKYYRTDENYYEEHPIIELNSNYEKYQYKIFAYYVADANDTTDTRFEYWNSLNFEDEDEFYDYVNEIKRRTLRITNVDVEYGDDLLTLSTCNSVFDSARLVVVARRVREDEDLYEGTKNSVLNDNVKWPNVYYRWNKNTYDPDADFEPYG